MARKGWYSSVVPHIQDANLVIDFPCGRFLGPGFYLMMSALWIPMKRQLGRIAEQATSWKNWFENSDYDGLMTSRTQSRLASNKCINPTALYQHVDASDNSFDEGWSNGVEFLPDGNGYNPRFFSMIIMREWAGGCVKRSWKFPSGWRDIQTDLPCPKGTS
ncbi:unnamed protein product [Penicillium camemberti]|uniref:Str. FM013 n=1 Tax=Penicillium camemberti (strain FM 013) TaxID=1429867 RepID=A0A0G4PRC3_PENC3|nr:unnamed protein product [Penicillium camemberti]